MLRQPTMLLEPRDPGEPPELLLSIEQVRGCGDDPLFLSQIHILIFKAINFVSAYKSLSKQEILPEMQCS